MQEGRDAVEDTLERMGEALAALRRGEGGLTVFRKDAHNLKGLGAVFGFPGVAVFAHRLEDYMADLDKLDEAALGDLQCFLDRTAELAENAIDASGEEIARLVRALPVRGGSFEPDDIEVRDVEILLVAPRSTATRYVASELGACGYRVTTVQSPGEVLEYVVHARPDLVIVSAILERFEGIDLVCALRAMPSTRNLPVALLTSMDRGDERLRDLPREVPVLTKGARFGDDVAEALSRLGIT
ncbi:MAG: response regulator [Alphaproteobacteria bacterium]|nr:MAG: response regulator [Alphaproteobacteria bacterium]